MKEQDKINDRDLWNQFFVSGKVADYLSYAAGCGKADALERVKSEWAGDAPHAGMDRSNGNYIETDACR